MADDLKEPKPVDQQHTEDDRNTRHTWLTERRRRTGTSVSIGQFAKAARQRVAMEKAAAAARPKPRVLMLEKLGVAPPPIPAYWTQLGPSVVAHGQADYNPIVSGRINSLAVGPGGTRVYAGAANGGVWYSEDTGANWSPIDLYALPLDIAALAKMDADTLSTGAIAVKFGAAAANDLIFVGTGEPQYSAVSDQPSGDAYFGVGIKSSPSGGKAPVWTLEGKNLAGHGIFRIAIDPSDASVVFAATTTGLFMRPRSGSFDNWTAVGGANLSGLAVCDVLVAGSGPNKVWFAAVWGPGAPGAASRVFMSQDANNPTGGTWTPVGGFSSTGRVALAASEPAAGASPIVYALCSDGNLYRLDTPTGNFTTVTGIPAALFFGGQGDYDMFLGVDPSDPDTVYVAGDTIYYKNWSLSGYKGKITGTPGNYTFPFNPANDRIVKNPPPNDSTHVANDKTWIGENVHADSHCVAFAQNADGTHDATNVWIGCDGGVFQSSQSGQRGTFQARNNGLAITELTYLAHHPDTDTVLYAGAQDQGSLRFRGDQVCCESPQGDGGGVTYDPNDGTRVMLQYTKLTLKTSTDAGTTFAQLAFPPVAASPSVAASNALTVERAATKFYGPLAAVATDNTHARVAFGTHRLWMTEDWGATWTTLPSNTNPYASDATVGQDVLDGKGVRSIAWAGPNRVFVATSSNIYRFDKSGATWTPAAPAALPTTGLPAGFVINAIAVEDAANGTLYAALGGANVAHIFYFDPAANSWVGATLGPATLDVPANAVVVDPAHPEQVYLATDVGVFKGVKDIASWNWTPFSEKLPVCAVTSLAIHPKTRMLRAATHGAGVWEIPLDSATLPDPDLYLRVNYADSGRLGAAGRPAWLDTVKDPFDSSKTLTHAMSPDIKVVGTSDAPSTPVDYFGFASLKDFDRGLNQASIYSSSKVYVEVHNRGQSSLTADSVRVLLLLAKGTPALPNDLAQRIQNNDTSDWLSDGWVFADPANPYHTLPNDIDSRLPQVVQYDVDFSRVGAFGGDSCCVAAFVNTDPDPITGTDTDINKLVMKDKHVAMRTVEVSTNWVLILGLIVVAVGVGVGVGVAVAESK